MTAPAIRLPKVRAGARFLLGFFGDATRRHRSGVRLGSRIAALAFRRRIAEHQRNRRTVVAIALVEHLGDLVAAAPIARQVRRRHPDAVLVWIARPEYRELAAALPEVDEVWTVGCLTEWMQVERRVRFDALFDLHLVGRYCAVCYAPKPAPAGSTPAVDADTYYHHGSLLDVFRTTAELPPDDDVQPMLALPPAAATRVDELDLPTGAIAVHARSNQTERDWDDDKWRILLEPLIARGLPVVEIGSRAAVAERVRGVIDLCGRLSILETAEVLRRCRVFVGIDSGPAHLANAIGTPGVVVLGRYRAFAGHVPYSGAYASDGATLVRASDGPAAAADVDAVARAVEDRLGRTDLQPGLVSVVVPAYGHAALIGETLRSVLAQTWPSLELIVVDDGSPDDTAGALAAWRDRLRYVRQPNRGAAAARNHGLALARGEFVAFLDDDDVWPADKLERQVRALANPAVVAVYGKHRVIGRDGDPTAGTTFPSGDVHAAFLARNWIHSLGQTLMRTAEVRAIGGFDASIRSSDDYDLYIRLARRGPFVFDDHVALHYRLHDRNASRSACEHARNHWKVVAKHVHPLARPRHARTAAAYFVPNLVQAARDASARARPRDAAGALVAALRFQPSLATRPWFVRALLGFVWETLRQPRRPAPADPTTCQSPGTRP